MSEYEGTGIEGMSEEELREAVEGDEAKDWARHPDPQDWTKHPDPQAGITHPDPQAGIGHPDPQAGMEPIGVLLPGHPPVERERRVAEARAALRRALRMTRPHHERRRQPQGDGVRRRPRQRRDEESARIALHPIAAVAVRAAASSCQRGRARTLLSRKLE